MVRSFACDEYLEIVVFTVRETDQTELFYRKKTVRKYVFFGALLVWKLQNVKY